MNPQTTLQQQPRERLEKFGAQTLPLRELVMLLLGSGTKKSPVEKIAQHLEKLFLEIPPALVTIQQLKKIPGIGTARACTLLAAIELTERLRTESSTIFTSPETVSKFLQHLHTAKREIIVGLYLNARFTLEHKETLAIGGQNQVSLLPRDVFGAIKGRGICNVILVHNHPSGSPQPSPDDIAFTERMRKAADLLGIKLLDHIILANGKWSSLKEKGVC